MQYLPVFPILLIDTEHNCYEDSRLEWEYNWFLKKYVNINLYQNYKIIDSNGNMFLISTSAPLREEKKGFMFFRSTYVMVKPVFEYITTLSQTEAIAYVLALFDRTDLESMVGEDVFRQKIREFTSIQPLISYIHHFFY